MTANVLVTAGAEDRPLSAFVDATHGSVRAVLAEAEPELGYKAIARLSGHLAAMWRTVYPAAGSQPGRSACLARAREVERALRLLERRLSGDGGAAGIPAALLPAVLADRLDRYWAVEQALVSRIEDGLAAEGRDKLARAYRRALACAPTRPHPWSPRSGPLCRPSFWLHSRWDRLLDTMDSRSGVGRDFLPPG